MTPKEILTEIANVWPMATKWISPPILSEMADRIAHSGIDAGQFRQLCKAHAVEDGAHSKPKPNLFVGRVRSITDAAKAARRAEVRNAEDEGWIGEERRLQSLANPQAMNVPAWMIVAAWYEHDVGSLAGDYDSTFRAARWVSADLRSRGASYNDSIYATASIYRIDPVELDRSVQDHLLVSREARLVNQKAIARIAARAKIDEDAKQKYQDPPKRAALKEAKSGAV